MKAKILFLCLIMVSLISQPIQGDVTTLLVGKPIKKDLSKGEKHQYQVKGEVGGFLHVNVEQIGIDVIILVFNPLGEKIKEVDSPTGKKGIETVEIEVKVSGFYRLQIQPYTLEGVDVKPGKYIVNLKENLTKVNYQLRLAAQRKQHQKVIQWIKTNAIPLTGVQAGSGFEDLQPLKEIIGEARIVSLGEATHGTREIFQLKHRMLEFLVEEMDFTIFGIEATMPEGFDVNEYVLNGRGDPAKALTGLYFWTWNTWEVLDMIRWMRQYNADPKHKKKVKFYGFDMQSITRAIKVVDQYLQMVAPQAAKLLSGSKYLLNKKNPYSGSDYYFGTKKMKQKALKVAEQILMDFDKNRAGYISRSSEDKWTFVRLHLQIILQNLQLSIAVSDNDGGLASKIRDQSMAENVSWILEHEGPKSKIVLWAHNYHVSTMENAMGYFLREKYGRDMVIFGFAFNQGSFQAIELLPKRYGGLVPFHVKPLPAQSLDATWAAAELPFFALHLKKIPTTGTVADWFKKKRRTRSFGAVYNKKNPINYASPMQITSIYDVLFFIDETTAARPNPGGVRRTRHQYLVQPKNLNFEIGDPGLIPEYWRASKHRLADFDYYVETCTEKPYEGKQCLRISRKKGKHYGENYGSISQLIKADLFFNKRIKLKAAVKNAGTGGNAYLFLSVSKGGFGPKATVFKDYMDDRPIVNCEKWKIFEIVGDVPADAKWISYGMVLEGEGDAYFDALSIEILGNITKCEKHY